MFCDRNGKIDENRLLPYKPRQLSPVADFAWPGHLQDRFRFFFDRRGRHLNFWNPYNRHPGRSAENDP